MKQEEENLSITGNPGNITTVINAPSLSNRKTLK
jgi:hypothetical protein